MIGEGPRLPFTRALFLPVRTGSCFCTSQGLPQGPREDVPQGREGASKGKEQRGKGVEEREKRKKERKRSL